MYSPWALILVLRSTNACASDFDEVRYMAVDSQEGLFVEAVLVHKSISQLTEMYWVAVHTTYQLKATFKFFFQL